MGGSGLNSHCYWGWLDYPDTPPLQTHAICCVWTLEGPQKIKRILLLDAQDWYNSLMQKIVQKPSGKRKRRKIVHDYAKPLAKPAPDTSRIPVVSS